MYFYILTSMWDEVEEVNGWTMPKLRKKEEG